MIRKVIIVVPLGGPWAQWPLPGAAEAARTDAEFAEGVKEGTQVGCVRESSLLVPKGDDAGLFWVRVTLNPKPNNPKKHPLHCRKLYGKESAES